MARGGVRPRGPVASALQAALREALEETGYKITRANPAYAAYMSPGSVTEKLHGFYAAVTDADHIADGGGLDDEQEDLEVGIALHQPQNEVAQGSRLARQAHRHTSHWKTQYRVSGCTSAATKCNR